MTGTLGPVERKGHALELDGDGGSVGGGDVVRFIEELVEVGVVGRLDRPAARGVREGGICVVDSEVHMNSAGTGKRGGVRECCAVRWVLAVTRTVTEGEDDEEGKNTKAVW